MAGGGSKSTEFYHPNCTAWSGDEITQGIGEVIKDDIGSAGLIAEPGGGAGGELAGRKDEAGVMDLRFANSDLRITNFE